MEKIVKYVVFDATVICLLLTVLALRWWKLDSNSFKANFTLNVVAEFIGMGLTATAAWLIAIWVTKKKLTHAMQSITRLRKDGQIAKETARAAVVFTVGFISPELLGHTRSSEPNAQCSSVCLVCDQELATENEPPVRCKYCGLPGKFWKAPTTTKV